jgi:hypothetical protein
VAIIRIKVLNTLIILFVVIALMVTIAVTVVDPGFDEDAGGKKEPLRIQLKTAKTLQNFRLHQHGELFVAEPQILIRGKIVKEAEAGPRTLHSVQHNSGKTGPGGKKPVFASQILVSRFAHA